MIEKKYYKLLGTFYRNFGRKSTCGLPDARCCLTDDPGAVVACGPGAADYLPLS